MPRKPAEAAAEKHAKKQPTFAEGLIPFRGVTLDELTDIAEKVEADRAKTRTHVDRPQGTFMELGDDAVCNNPECVRPFLAAGKTVYAFTGGPATGRVACVACSTSAHPGIEVAWQAKLAQMRLDPALVARMTLGEQTDRYGRRGEQAREMYEQSSDPETRAEAGRGMAFPRI